ncbi:MAG: OB-fold domain-containing protein [Chloroflexota bacterium]|nr:OB-fold domain-containing protein [Chloroflexota bacterium]
MAGITSYGAYVPLYRLSRADISKAWGIPGPIGEKAVANYDEDTLTMAVAAGIDCLKDIDPESVDGVYFASTSAPYKEKQSATIIATALGLNKGAITSDFANSLRGGTIALRAALDSVAAGSARNILVIASDMRLGAPRGDKEMAFGDGAAALLVGNSNNAVDIESTYSVFDEIFDTWRSSNDTYARTSEDRFLRDSGHTRIVPEAVSIVMKEHNLTQADFSKVVISASDPKQLAAAAGRLKLDTKTQVQDLLHEQIGNTGTALPLMLLVAALEEAKADDKLLLAAYGDGCDVLVMKVTNQLEKVKDRRGIKCHLESKRMIGSYQKYMIWRELIFTEPPARPPIMPVALPASWRDRNWGLSLRGSKCKSCGTPQYPMQRVCVICQSEDQYEPYAFSRQRGKVFTFSHDNLAGAIDPPSTIASVDFEGGGRIMCDMTDRDPEEVKTDMPVEMTFRKLHTVNGVHNYWWKCAPIRC